MTDPKSNKAKTPFSAREIESVSTKKSRLQTRTFTLAGVLLDGKLMGLSKIKPLKDSEDKNEKWKMSRAFATYILATELN